MSLDVLNPDSIYHDPRFNLPYSILLIYYGVQILYDTCNYFYINFNLYSTCMILNVTKNRIDIVGIS